MDKDLLTRARWNALALAAHEMADDAKSAGYRICAFKRRLAETGAHAWLEFDGQQPSLRFLVEQVSVRFCRSMVEEPTPQTLRRLEAEARLSKLALGATGRNSAAREMIQLAANCKVAFRPAKESKAVM